MGAGIILARQLGPELRGEWGLILLALQIVGLFHLGLGPAITYYTGKNDHDRGRILTFALVSSIVIGIVFSVIFFFLYPLIPRVWGGIPRTIMLIGIAAVPLTFLTNFFRSFLMGILKVFQSNMLDLFRGICYLAAVIVLIWIMKGSVFSAAVCYTASILVAFGAGIVLFTRTIKPSRTFDTSLVRPMFGYGFKAYVVIIFHFLNYRLDTFLIKYFLTSSDVAYYQIAASVAERMWYLPNALNSVLIPTLLAMDAGSTKFTTRVCRNGFFLIMILSAGLLVSARYLVVFLYGAEYYPVTYALYSILWGIVITTVYKVIFADFAAKKRLGVTIIAAFFSFLVNLVLNLYWIPRYGIVGAGMATSISKTVLTGILIAFLMRYEHVSLRELFIINREDVRTYRDTVLKTLRRIRTARR